jgi:Asp-tRNA(Asn)/Glu-tRNA(Gln) amidotransferase B subunit
MTKRQMKKMGISPDDFECILEERDISDFLEETVTDDDWEDEE